MTINRHLIEKRSSSVTKYNFLRHEHLEQLRLIIWETKYREKFVA